ncbi:hypothetical protein WR25_07302 [Diploscapter pachys]|uniref:Uncharacterized protein n=2 Tax=cellular organisms TaxID=131567 RepID=A0A2A2K8V2_9BILA|nr:hypothetical protein WR25_07302 [Diploscapter pachys]
MRLPKPSTWARSPGCAATNMAMVSPKHSTSCSAMAHLPFQLGQLRDLARRQCQQVLAGQGVLDGTRQARGEMRHQFAPLGQVEVLGHHGYQAPVGAARHRLAVHVAHPTPQQLRGQQRRLVVPVPVADVEGHARRHALRLGLAEKLHQGRQPPTCHRADLARQLQPLGNRGLQAAILAPQFQWRGVETLQAMLGGQVGQGSGIRRSVEQLLAPFHPPCPCRSEQRQVAGLAQPPYGIGTETRQADGNSVPSRNELRAQIQAPGRQWAALQALQQALERRRADAPGGLRQRADAVAHQRVPIQVVQRQQAQVLEQRLAPGVQHPHQLQGGDTIATEQRLRAVPCPGDERAQLLGEARAYLQHLPAQPTTPGDGGLEGIHALLPRAGAIKWLGDGEDVAITVVFKVIQRLLDGVAVVQAHQIDRQARQLPVDQYHGQVADQAGQLPGAVAQGVDDQAVDVVRLQGLQLAALLGVVTVGVAHHQAVAVLATGRLDSVHHRHGIGVADIRQEHADQPGATALEGTGHAVGAIAQALDDGFDPLRGRLGEQLPILAHIARDGCLGDAGRLRDLADMASFVPKQAHTLPNPPSCPVPRPSERYGDTSDFARPALEIVMTALFRISLVLMLAGMGMGDIVVASVGLLGLCAGAVMLSIRQDAVAQPARESEFIA